MNRNLENEIEQVEKKLNKATSERDVWRSSKGGQSNSKMAEQLVRSLEKQRDTLIEELNNQEK
jgi:cell division septum initiation protein DivIVA